MSKKTARNDITHDKIKTKPANKKYAEGWDRIFGGGSFQNGKDHTPDNTPQDGRVCDCEDAPCCGHYEL